MNFIYKGVIKDDFLVKMMEAYIEYKSAAGARNERIKANNIWFQSEQEKLHQNKKDEGGLAVPSTSAYIFNAIANKHADAMDNYPIPNILPREPGDESTAKVLSSVLPVVLDRINFKRTYSRNWWYKLKNGTCCYGVFFDGDTNSVKIEKIDLLNLYWQPDVTDIQDSKYLFLTTLVDVDALKEQYPEHKEHIAGAVKVEKHYGEQSENTRPQQFAEVVSCYYKKRVQGETQVHLIKWTNNLVLATSEDKDSEILSSYRACEIRNQIDTFSGSSEKVSSNNNLLDKGVEPQIKGGIYDHGKYPFVLDVMYPNENSPTGFGIVSVAQNQQSYVDKLNDIILKNAFVSGKQRFLVKDNGSLNEKEFLDVSKPLIRVVGDLNENYKELQTKPLDPFIINHREKMITEIKEITGNRDFQQGGTMGGVTAYGAIVALQQAGEKLSRDMIQESYEAYKDIIEMVIDIVRQFYDEEEIYRITGESGQEEYKSFSNEWLMGYDKPVMFDVGITPQKENPWSREANNQLMLQLWQVGVFNPQMADSALMLLESMSFDGKDKIVSALRKKQEEAKLQQQMMAQQQIPQGMGQGMGGGEVAPPSAPSNMPNVQNLGSGYSIIE